MRILLADDEALNRRIATAILARAGHEVIAVADGAAAVAAATAGGFDLVLLDVRMAEMDGPAAARAIRAAGAVDLPILALSGSAFPADVEACLAAGMNGFLTKPLAMAALDDALRGIARPRPWERPVLLDGERLALLARELPADLMRASLAACLLSLDQSAASLAGGADRDAVGALAHRIAGTAATYGLAALRAAALAAEAAAKDPAADFPAAAGRLTDLLPPSRAALENYVAAL